jgi:hypothetical protein
MARRVRLGAGLGVVPRSLWMRLTDPSAVIAGRISSQLPSLRLQKFGRPGVISAEPIPSRLELLHTVFAVLAGAFGLGVLHRNGAADSPGPQLCGAAAVLYRDRADLDVDTVVLEDYPMVIMGLLEDRAAA